MNDLEKFSLHLPYKMKAVLSLIGKYNLDSEYPNEFSNSVCTIESLSFNNDETISGCMSVDKSTRGYSFDFENVDEINPYLFSLDMLTKKITLKDYNDGKPFVPILELIKLQEKHGKWINIAPTIDYNVKIIKKPFGKIIKVSKLDKWVLILSLSEICRSPFFIIKKLLKWHFAIGFEKGEYIEVTNENNPY